MGLFWKKPKNKTLTDGQERFADKIGMAITHRQTQIATYLNRKTQYWNRASKITALIIFCLVFGGASICLLLKAIL
ncbi:hypothetical protein HDF24_14630 [Mucilaginibacter sp. X4EP1]|uniref:hypothetical protein n=1 Tax=Mucilaginibacter sp. X4EP1 TaxID=2723092 RepID=UPI002168FA9E|nr:hypothetical protein [Mucilaginibacter sp. X4EP1]MCS3815472.1 hypothetical protein [Mucilaginibacter sp. X4EP1]